MRLISSYGHDETFELRVVESLTFEQRLTMDSSQSYAD